MTMNRKFSIKVFEIRFIKNKLIFFLYPNVTSILNKLIMKLIQTCQIIY